MDDRIETTALTKNYHKAYLSQPPAVNKVNLRVPNGSIYGFLGPNGAGKSTTMKLLLGLIRPDSGEISIGGTPLTEKSRTELLRDMGSLIESPSYYGNLTAWENLKISCMMRGLPDSEISRVLSIVRLDGQKRKRAAHFSLGMKQRLGLAAALLGNPRLVLLDEPTNGLDPAGIHEIRELIKSLPARYGITVMVSSHLLSEVEQIADHIGIISRGSLIFQDSLKVLQAKSSQFLTLRTSDNEKARSFLREKGLAPEKWAGSAGIHSGDAPDGKSLCIPLLSDRLLAPLLRELTDLGVDIYRIEEHKKNLEEIYLEMVKEASL